MENWLKKRRLCGRPVRPTATHILISCCLDSKSCVLYFSVSETLKSPWFLVSYVQCVPLIPLADIFSHIWRLKGKKKNFPKHKPQTKKEMLKLGACYRGNLGLPSSCLRHLDLACNGCFSDGLWPPVMWLWPSLLKRKTGFGMVPSPGNIVYTRVPNFFV